MADENSPPPSPDTSEDKLLGKEKALPLPDEIIDNPEIRQQFKIYLYTEHGFNDTFTNLETFITCEKIENIIRILDKNFNSVFKHSNHFQKLKLTDACPNFEESWFNSELLNAIRDIKNEMRNAVIMSREIRTFRNTLFDLKHLFPFI